MCSSLPTTANRQHGKCGRTEFWAAGTPFYDPADVRAPVLALHGEWDVEFSKEMVMGYFDRLTGTPDKRLIEIGEATHSFILEANRWRVLDAVQSFLDGASASEVT